MRNKKMEMLLFGNASDPAMDPTALHGMFTLRHKVFFEKLGWDVTSNQGMEQDHFDDLNPLYMIARHQDQYVEGCWRFLPTTGPYMLKDTFPQLLRGEDAPHDSNIWELSRFAVSPVESRSNDQIVVNDITMTMLQKAVIFAEENQVTRYATVISVAMERLLKRIGIPLTRFGDQKAQKIGKVLSVACWIDINEQLHRAVFNNCSLNTQHAA
jgi:acyl homoserine lactone synthase